MIHQKSNIVSCSYVNSTQIAPFICVNAIVWMVSPSAPIFYLYFYDNLNQALPFVAVCRLQLKRGLLWYRHFPKLQEMVKYGSSRALVWTNLRQFALRVLFTSKKLGKMITWSKKKQTCCFSWKQIFEKLFA